MDRIIQNVPVRDVQADEIWSFIGKKEKRVKVDDDPTLGDSYTWVAIEAKTKLVLAHVVGKRTGKDAIEFTRKVRRATSASQRFQLTIKETKKRTKKLFDADNSQFYLAGKTFLFHEIPDSHSVAIVCSHLGKPLYDVFPVSIQYTARSLR